MRFYPLLLAGLLLLPAQMIAQTVMIGTAEQYEAGEYTVDPVALQEFEKALGEVLCQRAELSCEWKVTARDDLLSALRAGEVDVVMAAIPITAEMGEGIETTASYLQLDPFVYAGLPGTEMHVNVLNVATISDPAIETIVASTGYIFEVYPTLEEALKTIENGGAEAVLGERENLVPLVEASGGRFAVINHQDTLRPGVVMALRSEDIDLRFSFEDRIYDMTQDGSLNALTKEWFGIDAAVW